MSIEAKLDALTAALNNLAAAYTSNSKAASALPPIPQPLATVAPSPLPPAAPAAAPMPPFVMPGAPAVPQAPAVPFTDGKGLLQYIMDAYKSMGAEKGARIQGVLTQLGVGNINEVKSEQYAALYAGIEQLKAAP